MKKKKIIWYNPKLIPFARELRNHSTKLEIIFWLKSKGKALYGYDFIDKNLLTTIFLIFIVMPSRRVEGGTSRKQLVAVFSDRASRREGGSLSNPTRQPVPN